MPVCEHLYNRQIKGKFHYDVVTGKFTDYYPVPCGKCTSCKIQKAKEWALRCTLELPYWEKSIFTTLTYDDENEPLNGSTSKEDLQEFFDKLRNKLKPTGQKIKFLACTEYGETKNRPHAHAIIFGIGLNENDWYYSYKQGKQIICYRSENQIIEKCWNKGEVYNGYVTYNSSRYVASYVFKKYYDDLREEVYTKNGLENPGQIESKGIAKQWWIENQAQTLKRGYIMLNGTKNSIPQYFCKLAKKNEKEKELKEAQNKHAIEKYKKYLKDNNIELPKWTKEDDYNKRILTLQEQVNIAMRYEDNIEKQNILQGQLANHRNNLFYKG